MYCYVMYGEKIDFCLKSVYGKIYRSIKTNSPGRLYLKTIHRQYQNNFARLKSIEILSHLSMNSAWYRNQLYQKFVERIPTLPLRMVWITMKFVKKDFYVKLSNY